MIMPIIAVKDVEGSAAYYTEKLGFNLDFTLPGADGKASFAGISLDKASFGLNLDPEGYERGKGVVFMVYVPDSTNIDQYYADVQAKGVAIREPLKTEYWGDRTFTVIDPDGFELCLCKTVKQMSPDEIAAAVPKA